METYRNWVLFNFHFQQTLLKEYNTPGDVYNQHSCSPIETWRPKGNNWLIIPPLKNYRFLVSGKYAMSNVINKKNKFQKIYAVDSL